MKYAFFRIPATYASPETSELNSFLSSHRIVIVEKELVKEDNSVYWAFCVEYCDAADDARNGFRNRIDYRDILSAEDFALFSRLRDLRKKMAEEQKIPVYTILTNEQLAEIVSRKVKTRADLEKIDGIGKGKIERYGGEFLSLLKEPAGETGGKPLS